MVGFGFCCFRKSFSNVFGENMKNCKLGILLLINYIYKGKFTFLITGDKRFKLLYVCARNCVYAEKWSTIAKYPIVFSEKY